jgi:hypothetical protein
MPAIINPSKAFENILAASKASGGWTTEKDGELYVVVLAGPYTGSWLFQTRPNRTVWSDTVEAVHGGYGGLRVYQLKKLAFLWDRMRQAVMNTRVPLFWAPHHTVLFSSDLHLVDSNEFEEQWRDGKIPSTPKGAAGRKRVLAKLPHILPPVTVVQQGSYTFVPPGPWAALYFFTQMADITEEALARKLAEQPKRWAVFGDNVVMNAQTTFLMAIVSAADALKARYEHSNPYESRSIEKDIGYIREATDLFHAYFPDLPVRETLTYLEEKYLAIGFGDKSVSEFLYHITRLEDALGIHRRDNNLISLRTYIGRISPSRGGDLLRYPKGVKDRVCFAKNFFKTWSTKKALRLTCPNIEAAHKIKRFHPEDIPMMKWALNYIPSVRQKIPQHASSREIGEMAKYMKSRGVRAAEFRKLFASKDGWQKLQNLHGALLPFRDNRDGHAFREYLAESVKGRRIIAALDRRDWTRLVKEAPTIMRAFRGQESLHEDGLMFHQFARVKEQTEVSEARIEALQNFRYPPGVYPLIYEEDYAAEGDKMDHCIYSYRVSRKSLFFGFDCGSTNATLEVSLAGEVHQFYAEHNGPPSEECKQLLQQFLAMNEDRFTAFREAGRTRVNPRKRPSRRRRARQPRRRR